MGINQDFKDILHHLNEDGVEYLVVGAYAVVYYSEPRYTKDIDIWINSTPENAKRVYNALKDFGAPVRGLTLDDLQNENLVYQIGIKLNRINILMGMKNLGFDKAWRSRKTAHYGGEKMHIIGMDDLIENKLLAGRPKDKEDVKILKRVKELKKNRKNK